MTFLTFLLAIAFDVLVVRDAALRPVFDEAVLRVARFFAGAWVADFFLAAFLLAGLWEEDLRAGISAPFED
jgi:hypothetical protein